jgi:K+-transporting ATPase KdpF subunit
MKHRFQPDSISLYFFCTLCLTLAFSPIVQAATGGVFTPGQSYALALLGLVTFSLFVYLFVVIFQPERF